MKRKAPGILPSPGWLYDNGYGALAATMSRHPEAFAHIRQKRLRHPLSYWINVAERLADAHGHIPCSGWLQSHGLNCLDMYIRDDPSVFAHLTRDWKGGRRIDEWKKIAGELVNRFGHIPNRQKLRALGYGAMIQLLSKRKDVFKRFRYDGRKRRSPSEWVPVAEKIERQHGGLPGGHWLEIHGFSGLYKATLKCPALFRHIRRLSRSRQRKALK